MIHILSWMEVGEERGYDLSMISLAIPGIISLRPRGVLFRYNKRIAINIKNSSGVRSNVMV